MHITTFQYKAVRGLNFQSDDGRDPWPSPIEPRQFNLLIGPNGGGKTTILDIIRCLAEPAIVSSIARENHTCMDSSFHIETTSGAFTVKVLDAGTSDIHARRAIFKMRRLDGTYLTESFEERFSHGEAISPQETPAHHLGGKVNYINCTNNIKIPMDRVADIMNEYRWMFPQICQDRRAVTVVTADADRLWISFEAENAVDENGEFYGQGQQNAVPYDQLPSGWISASRIIDFILCCEDGSIALLEEPEICLHPSLQRELMGWLLGEAGRRGIQVFAATHSSVFINIFSAVENGSVFCANTHIVREWDASYDVIRSLGVTPSDILQANGIVWVEGESDRLYIESWIDEYCRISGVIRPRTGIDYAILSYGGAMLAHLCFETDVDFSALRVNQNAALVMDRDDDYGPDGDEFVGIRRYKEQAHQAIRNLGGFVWITEGPTIESYLPEDVRPQTFPRGKVGAALKAIAAVRNLNIPVVGRNSTLQNQIKGLLSQISQWGQSSIFMRGDRPHPATSEESIDLL